MSDPLMPFDEGTTLENIPLFPLPEVVMFPRVVLRLHIFEPRYRTMTRDALAGAGLIAVGRIVEGEAVDEHDHPPVDPMLGVGQIIHHEALGDGRYNIALLGRGRAQFQELPFEAPYRRVSAYVVGEHQEAPGTPDVSGLVAAATRFASVVRRKDPKFDLELPKAADAGTLADALASLLLISGEARQHVLDARSARERVRRCTEALVVQEAMMAPRDAVMN